MTALSTYGGLNKNGPHRLIDSNTWSLRKRLRRCEPVEVGVALFEEVTHWGELWDFVSSSQDQRFSLPVA